MNNFFAYVQQVELMTFFSGYTLLYAIINVIAGDKESGNYFKKNIISVLPLSYALICSLYLGLFLKNLYVNYSAGNVNLVIYHPYLVTWAFLAILFWIPLFRKKVVLTFLHSVVFFFILVKDLVIQIASEVDANILKNDMKIFTASFLLNLAAFTVMGIFYFTLMRNKKGFRYS